ncbi:MAG TPA: TonB-dependent receptor [Gemmatimonadales bacterium]|jgi:iron complex outermembrane receptor protein
MHFLTVVLTLLSAPSGTVSGRVTTSSGDPIADVQVSLTDLRRSTTTDSSGRYTIADVPDGTFTVSFQRIGYAPAVRRIVASGGNVTADVTMKESIVELTGIQVTASANATSALNSPQPTSVRAGDELRQSQSPTLGETLEGVAGVHSLSTGVGIGKPVIRGLTSNRVLVLDNGQRLETAQWGDEHSPNVETANAERIEVIRGPASVLYGSDALGGVVNVVQKDLPEIVEGRAFVRGNVSAAYGSNNGMKDGSFGIEGGSHSVGFRGGFSGRTSGDVHTPDYALWNSGDEAIAGNGTVGTRGSWGSLSASFSQRQEKIELTDEDPAATPLQRIATSHARTDLWLPLGSARLDVSTGYERNRRREFEDENDPTVALGLLTQTYLADVRYHHAPVGVFSGLIGFSGVRNTFDKFGEETLIPSSAANNAAIYAFEQTEGSRVNVSLGARYDYRNLSVDADTVLGVATQDRSWSSVTGNVGLLVHLGEPTALVVNVGRGFRAPSSFDLYSNGVHEGTTAFERGNPNLRTEKSVNTDVALRAQSTRLAFEVGTFLNLIQDYIYTVPTGTVDSASGFEIYDVTQGDARLAGFEASLQWHPAAYLHLQGTADYVRGQNTSTHNPLPNMPPLRVTWVTRIEGGEHASGTLRNPYFSFGGEVNARQTRMDPAEEQFYADAFGGVGYQSRPYTLVNFGAGASWLVGSRTFTVDLSLRNAFDKRYADYLSRIKTNALDPGMGRSLTARITTEF